jgi:hypothetical protein
MLMSVATSASHVVVSCAWCRAVSISASPISTNVLRFMTQLFDTSFTLSDFVLRMLQVAVPPISLLDTFRRVPSSIPGAVTINK